MAQPAYPNPVPVAQIAERLAEAMGNHRSRVLA